jgi:predicted DNA-binding protein
MASSTESLLRYTQVLTEERQGDFPQGSRERVALEELEHRLEELSSSIFQTELSDYFDLAPQELKEDVSPRLVRKTTRSIETEDNWESQVERLEALAEQQGRPKKKQTAEILLEVREGLSEEALRSYFETEERPSSQADRALPFPLCLLKRDCHERPPL